MKYKIKMLQLYTQYIIVFLCCLVCISADDCSITYATDFADPDPVLLLKTSNGYDLMKPENAGLIFNKHHPIVVACPGYENKLTLLELAPVKCKKNKALEIDSHFTLKEISCENKVKGDIFESIEDCGSSGNIIQIGHYIQEVFKDLFDVCYDNTEGNTLYAKHIIYGSAINYSPTAGNSPDFNKDGLASGITGDEYKQDSQLTTFKEILGDDKLAQKYINKESSLERGHLAPAADMIYRSSKYSTYFYINTVPQWKQINKANGQSLERCIRTLAGDLKEDIMVYTGTHEVLKLEDKNKQLKEIYLAEEKLPVPKFKLPVPKFIWKVFYSLKTGKGIAFVIVNNPFVELTDAKFNLCTKIICDNNKWGTGNWDMVGKGLIYCCEIDDLRKTVKIIPNLKVTGVQQGLTCS